MVVIRLRRGGRTHDPHYRLVVQEKRSKLNGDYIENIGHYHPTNNGKDLVVDKERAEHWIRNGAQLSTTVNNLLVKAGVLKPEAKISRVYATPKKEAVAEAAPAPKAEATEEVAEEAPAEEAVAEETPTEAPAEAAPAAEAPVESAE